MSNLSFYLEYFTRLRKQKAEWNDKYAFWQPQAFPVRGAAPGRLAARSAELVRGGAAATCPARHVRAAAAGALLQRPGETERSRFESSELGPSRLSFKAAPPVTVLLEENVKS